MKNASVYVNFPGNAEEALKHYKSVLGGDYSLMRYGEMPGGTAQGEDRDKVMHGSLPLSGNLILMVSDVPASAGKETGPGNNFYLYVETDRKEEADRVFAGLSSGGKVEMPMQDTFWGSYFGSLTDRFGVGWMVGFEYPKP